MIRRPRHGLAHASPSRSGPRASPKGVTAVLVDVVVRDKRGQPVRDLTEADFEIVEDGVPQKIGSFTPIFEGAPAKARRLPLPAPAHVCSAAHAGSGSTRRSDRHGARLRRLESENRNARGAGGAGLPRRQGGDAELRRHLRHRPVAEAATSPFTRNGAACARR